MSLKTIYCRFFLLVFQLHEDYKQSNLQRGLEDVDRSETLRREQVIGSSKREIQQLEAKVSLLHTKCLLTWAVKRGSMIFNICSRTWVPADSIACTGIARKAKGISMLTWIFHNKAIIISVSFQNSKHIF